MLGVAVGRLVTGAPPAGWDYNADDAHYRGTISGWETCSTSLLALLLLGIAAVAVASTLRALRDPRVAAAGPDAGSVLTGQDGSARSWRLAAALGLFGAMTAVLSALVAAVSRHQQQTMPRVGHLARDPVTQVGWSFMITAVIAGILAVRWKPARFVPALTAILGVGLTLTLLANARIAETYRRDPLVSVTSQISEATISFDITEAGNARRCSLIDSYTERTPSRMWIAGPNLLEDLDRLMQDRYGYPFCDQARPVG